MCKHKVKCELKDSPPQKQESNNNERSPMMEKTVATPGRCCVCHGGDNTPEHLAEHSTEILAKIGLIDKDDNDDETRPTCVVCYRVFASKLKYIKHFAEKHPKKYNFLTTQYLGSTSKGDPDNCQVHNIGQDKDNSVDAAGVSGGDQDQGTSSSGCKVDNYVHLGRVGFGGVSCGNDVSTQTEESHESAETLLELGSFLHDELEKYLEKIKKNKK